MLCETLHTLLYFLTLTLIPLLSLLRIGTLPKGVVIWLLVSAQVSLVAVHMSYS